jgi:hypothetical protein
MGAGMPETMFINLGSVAMAAEIMRAERLVCYVGPGILEEQAKALAKLASRIGPELVMVFLDLDERVFRMGFGTLKAVNTLREASIDVRSTPGLRTGLVIVDDTGFIFTPTALYIEAEERPDAAPNAMRLTRE